MVNHWPNKKNDWDFPGPSEWLRTLGSVKLAAVTEDIGLAATWLRRSDSWKLLLPKRPKRSWCRWNPHLQIVDLRKNHVVSGFLPSCLFFWASTSSYVVFWYRKTSYLLILTAFLALKSVGSLLTRRHFHNLCVKSDLFDFKTGGTPSHHRFQD